MSFVSASIAWLIGPSTVCRAACTDVRSTASSAARTGWKPERRVACTSVATRPTALTGARTGSIAAWIGLESTVGWSAFTASTTGFARTPIWSTTASIVVAAVGSGMRVIGSSQPATVTPSAAHRRQGRLRQQQRRDLDRGGEAGEVGVQQRRLTEAEPAGQRVGEGHEVVGVLLGRPRDDLDEVGIVGVDAGDEVGEAARVAAARGEGLHRVGRQHAHDEVGEPLDLS